MKTKIEGGKRQKGTIFTQTGQLHDVSGAPLPKIPNMVGNCVGFHRKKMMPIKTIYLCPVYYHDFRSWFRRLCTEREADIKHELLTWDGVEIEMMESNHLIRNKNGTDQFDWDFYIEKPLGNA